MFCADPKVPNALCPVLPAYIGPDPKLKNAPGYQGLRGNPPTNAADDVETPFDNMAWQMFVALNWTKGASGLRGRGLRIWQTYPKVAALFGPSPGQSLCGISLP